MVLYLSKDRFFVVQETFEGQLVKTMAEAAGNGGFGYDPLFFTSTHNCTAAELSKEEKNAISHRGKAMRELVARLMAEQSTRDAS